MNNAQRTHAHRRWAANYSAARARVHHMAQQAAAHAEIEGREAADRLDYLQAMREAREQ